ncbi:hypothetical protein [Pedobacter frigoris]|uniref:hypothetical protein n=1 Tax=Pedobacter frigoris TaxID=2571272 RepID=UPI00292E986A|nr:hypothetical protein [Pedobacter frigoris]
MWEKLTIYRQLDKKDINKIFKNFGLTLLSLLEGYIINQTSSVIKISRQVGQLEQAIFIERNTGGYTLNVSTSIKPIDFYKQHKFTMVNIVPLGEIMNNHRRTSYPLTQEWNELAVFLAARINTEVESYFEKYNSFNKIIDKRKDMEPKNFSLDNKYELLIYAAIRTKNKSLLNFYLDKKLSRTVTRISQSEYLKPNNNEIDEVAFLTKLKTLAQDGDFISIEDEIVAIHQIQR